jgi:MFS family permease
MTLREAQRSARFWRQGSAFFLMACAIGGVYAHFVPMLLDSGLTAEQARNVAALFGLAVIAGRLLAGVLLDRFFGPYLAVCFVLVAASGMGMLLLPGSHDMRWTAIAIGLAFGTELDIAAYMSARYFGTRAIGAIYGWQFGMFSAGGIASPILYGSVYDHTHSYAGALLISGALMLGAIPLFLSLGAYATPAPEADGLPHPG